MEFVYFLVSSAERSQKCALKIVEMCQYRTRRFSGYLDSIERSKLSFETVILSVGGDFFNFGISLFSKLRVVQLHGKRFVNWPD